MTMMRYRSDIDGMRAVAVFSVILFHALPATLSGGYIGVDVFFVISGYLITNIILGEEQTGGFSLATFYERRIRRLLPALTVVLSACLLAGLFLLAPVDQVMLHKQVIATVAFASNILFYRQGGYFDTMSDLKPLLHTWSLAVEEQFYIVFPLLLIFCLRRKPALTRPLIVFCALGSFIFSMFAAHLYPIFNFYMPSSRMWEILAGACLALGAVPVVRHRLLREAGAMAGIVSIVAAAVLYGPVTRFPGLATLAPVLGAAAVLHMAPGTMAGRLLSAPPLVYAGLISYSLYLWHWPVIVFRRYVTLDAGFSPLDTGQVAAVVAVSLGLAVVSHHVIERPFRNRRFFSTRQVFAGAAVAMVLLLAPTGLMLTKTDTGRAEAADPVLAHIAQVSLAFQNNPCLGFGAALPVADACVLGVADRSRPVTVALWGDSQTAALAPAVDTVGQRLGLRIKQYSKAGCPPFLAQAYDPVFAMLRDCPAFNTAVFQAILDDPAIRQVVLAVSWPDYLDGKILMRADDQPLTREGTYASIIGSLERIAAEMHRRGGRLTVVGVVPTPNVELPVCLRSALTNGSGIERCTRYSAAKVRHNAARVERMLLAPVVERGASVTPIDAVDAFCDADTCATMDGHIPYYMDQIHLTAAGAGRLAERLAAALR